MHVVAEDLQGLKSVDWNVGELELVIRGVGLRAGLQSDGNLSRWRASAAKWADLQARGCGLTMVAKDVLVG